MIFKRKASTYTPNSKKYLFGEMLQSFILYIYRLPYKYVIRILISLYIFLFFLSAYSYYMLMLPSLWEKDNFFIWVSILVPCHYILLNLGHITTNFTGTISQLKTFQGINFSSSKRANIERDIKATGDIHNLFGGFINIILLFIFSLLALYKIGFWVLTIYCIFLLLTIILARILHGCLVTQDTNRRKAKDTFIDRFQNLNIRNNLTLRRFELKKSWNVHKLVTLTRFVYNVMPLLAFLTIASMNYLDIIKLSRIEIASLVIIFSNLVDISDNLSMASSLYSKIKVCLNRVKKIQKGKSKSIKSFSYSIIADNILKEDVANSRWGLVYLNLIGLIKKQRIFFLGLMAFIFIINYSFLRYYFDLTISETNRIFLLFMVMCISIFFLIIGDFLFKKVFHDFSIILGEKIIYKLKNNDFLTDSDIEVLSHDVSILDDGISFSVTECLYAISTVLITTFAFFLAGGSWLIAFIMFTLFFFLQRTYRKIAIQTKILDIKLTSKSASLLTQSNPMGSTYYLSSLVAQLANTLNNRLFMVIIGLLVGFLVFGLSYSHPASSGFNGVDVALVALILKLSNALAYAIRYLSQLEGWSVSLGRIMKKIH